MNSEISDVNIKPIQHPYWEDLPWADPYVSITPDVLHQLYQGVIKHLISWVKEACGAAELDARCRRMPPNHQIHHFAKGISSLSKVTGREHADIARILLGLVLNIPLKNGASSGKLVRAIRGLLDFLYLAQYPMHSTYTLKKLDDALKLFHDNKDIFIELGIRTNFNIPKLHYL
ncbi:hypothetical protein K474DRAFT_1686805 [Panus rudis PR-1116 ss-1]|nr:hypothetical protein K474DRAFT_1686805 [Panus rudis PR-1116 ss-1]